MKVTVKRIIKAVTPYGIVVIYRRSKLHTKPTEAKSSTQTELFRSADYWEERYAVGGNSGAGSYDNLAEWKAEILNDFVKKNKIKSVIEFGCGDGNQLSLAKYPQYIGFDVSKTAVGICKKLFKGDTSKQFYELKNYENQKADLSMSLDVLYHLVEYDVYEAHINSLFKSARKFVVIYAADSDDHNTATHVQSRKFKNYIKQNIRGWKLSRHIPNKYPCDENDPDHTSWSDFYIYEKRAEDNKRKK